MSTPRFQLRSSIGKKLLNGITGVLLLLFIVAHLAGNLTIFVGKDALNAYAATTHSLGPLLIVIELGLAASYEWLRSNAEKELRREKQRADRLHAEQRAVDQRFQSELKALVEERTQALEQSHRELARAERLASIGTLAAGVAHEINNPVGGILISAQYALACEDHPEREAIWRAALMACAPNGVPGTRAAACGRGTSARRNGWR